MLIESDDLTLRRGERELLRDFAWVACAGERWAVIGANGSGKSTLLQALAHGGGPAVVAGRIRRAPGAWLAAVEQQEATAASSAAAGDSLRDLARRACAPLLELAAELERRAAALGATPDAAELEAYGAWQALFEARGGYDLETRLDAALTRVGLPSAAARPADRAAGGERRRARLAGALVAGADVLVLDEPTNHLDLEARGWLADQLVRFPGAVVFASHDRAWIDAVATHVLVLGDGVPRTVRGGWSAARRAADDARRADAKAERLRRRRVAELEAMAAELRAQGHRNAAARRRRAERELAGLRPSTPAPTAPPAPKAPRAPTVALAGDTAGGELARLDHLGRGELLRDVSLTLRGGERWALVGPSGSGKTTLLRLLAGELEDDDPRARRWWRPGVSVWHVDQHRRGLADDATPLAAVAAWVGGHRAEGLLAQVRLPPPTWTRPAATLSGGERARAGLALLMAREADVLLLDEPTNDLDLPMIEALEAALMRTPAAVVVATHDARLVASLAAEVVTIEGGSLVRWRGGLEGWRRGVRRLEADRRPPAPADTGPEPAAEAASDDEQAWDRERAAAEEVLADPRRWGEREIERWRARRRAAEEALLGALERRAAPQRPPYRTREGPWVVWGEPSASGLHAWLDGDEPLAHVTVRVLTTAAGRVGHVVPRRADDRSLTRSARHALWRGAARLAVYVHAVDAAQVAGPDAPAGFRPLAPGWWVWRRAALEQEERWRPTGTRRGSRRRNR